MSQTTIDKYDYEAEKRFIVNQLYRIGCFKTGTFKLRSGKISDFYIDLRDLTQHPDLLDRAAQLIAYYIIEKGYISNLTQASMYVCGIPYGAVPLATLVSKHLNHGMIMVRKKPKEHGLQKQIEGLDKLPNSGHVECILIDDVITSGTSIRETVEIFKQNSSINILSAFVLVDREDPSRNSPIDCFGILSLTEIKSILQKDQGVSFDKDIRNTKTTNQYSQRALITNNTQARELFTIMSEKKTNLIVSIDFTDVKKVYGIVNAVCKWVCAVKFHADTWYNDASEIEKYSEAIADLASRYNFMIFEDRKFADIGNTVQQQFNSIAAKYRRLDLVTVLPIFGEGTLTAIGKCSNFKIGQFIVRQGSTDGNLFTDQYLKGCTDMGLNNENGVVTGFICQKRESIDHNGFVYATPGVNIEYNTDGQNQKYRTIDEAIIRDNCDAIIVGRGITDSLNPEETAKMYAIQGYEAYQNKLLI